MIPVLFNENKFLISLHIVMNRILTLILSISLAITGCKKNDGPKLSGTDTINNILYGTGPYYALGFSVTSGKNVSTSESPLDVVTINAFPDNFNKTYFDAQNYNNSFYRYGVYTDAATASLAFKNLTSFNVTQWKITGDSVNINQIWLFRTSSETFAKIRIISAVGEIRNNIPYVECTFEWAYQPDGSLTFPGK
jgi:hypothetical protein